MISNGWSFQYQSVNYYRVTYWIQ